MAAVMTKEIDYLAARLHGRRSRLAEVERLDTFCRIRTLPELARTVYPDTEFREVAAFQRRLVQDLARELSEFPGHLTGPGSGLLTWMLVRFKVENLKVLIRGLLTRTPREVVREYLIVLPKESTIDTSALASAESLETFAELLPKGTLRNNLKEAVALYSDQTQPFFFEAAMDRGYFQGLLVRADGLTDTDKEAVWAMVLQEVDIFHLMLVVRGRFHYGLNPEWLRPLHVRGTKISGERFRAMLTDPDLRTAASRIVGCALDALPSEPRASSEASATVDPAALEAFAWKRFLRLANRAFRLSHMGLGTVVGYAGIRRVEVANLITLSEGIRAGMAAEAIRSRLIPRSDLETAHV
jgi:vacuolar-type H+-ATPase subunit C/Vma6